LHIMRALIFAAAAVMLTNAADLKPVFPANAPKPIGPYVPGISAGAYFYVSGQGARDAAGKLPSTFEEQTRQCLQNVKDILAADGLTMQHVVWAQVFVQDMKQLAVLDRVYATFFTKDAPARSLVGVAKMPGDTPVEIAVVAVRDLGQRKITASAPSGVPVSGAVQVGNRLYLSGVLGLDPKNVVPKQAKAQVDLLLTQMRDALAKSGMELRDMAYARVYIDGAMPFKILRDLLTEALPSETALAVTQTAALPRGAHIEISGIASRKAKRAGECVLVEDTLYCPSEAGTIEQALNRVKASLDIAKMNLGRVVVSNVFLDDIQNFAAMNKIYAATFGKWLPTRVTLQPTQMAEELNLTPSTTSAAPATGSPRMQISIIAVQ
jgi:2-iminobutanoate/2-iminopropanoate deaminase